MTQKSTPEGVTLDEDITDLQKFVQNSPTILRWVLTIHGAKDTLYQGEKFKLQFLFSAEYPLESPEVMFIGTAIPVHPHIYSNGHICLSILYDAWSPALTGTYETKDINIFSLKCLLVDSFNAKQL